MNDIDIISIDKVREALGKEAEGMSDVEIAEVRYSLFRKLESWGLDVEEMFE